MASYFSKINNYMPSRAALGEAALWGSAAIATAASLPLVATGLALTTIAVTNRKTLAEAFTRCKRQLPDTSTVIRKTGEVWKDHSTAIVATALTAACEYPTSVGPVVAAIGASAVARAAYLHPEQRNPPVYVPGIGNVNPFNRTPDSFGVAHEAHTRAEAVLAKEKEKGFTPQSTAVAQAPAVSQPSQQDPAVAASEQQAARHTKLDRQVEEVCKRVSCAGQLYAILHWGCGIESDTQTLLNLSDAASKPGADLWQVFRSHYQHLGFWQRCGARLVSWILKILPVSRIVDTYIKTAYEHTKSHLTNSEATNSVTKLIQGFLKEVNNFLVIYNGATEAFANEKEPKGDLDFYQDKSIRSNYADSKLLEEDLRERPKLEHSKALRALCEKFIAAFVDGYSPEVPGFWGKIGNTWLRKQMKKWLPALLQTGVTKGVDYTKPQNIAFSITLKKFFREQFADLRQSLKESNGSSSPPQVAGIELLPTVIAELSKAIYLSGEVSTQETLRKKLAKGTEPLGFAYELYQKPGATLRSAVPNAIVQPEIQKYLVLGCRYIFHYLSDPDHVQQLFGRLVELTIESFSSNLVHAHMNTTDFNAQFSTSIPGDHLSALFDTPTLQPGQTKTVNGVTFTVQSDPSILAFTIDHDTHMGIKEKAQEMLETDAAAYFREAINKGLADTDPQEVQQTTDSSLTAQKDSAGQIFASLSPLCTQMQEKVAAGTPIHAEIVSLAQRMSILTDDAKLKTELDKQLRDPAKKAAVLRALHPIYETSARITTRVEILQNRQIELDTINEEIRTQTSFVDALRLDLAAAVQRLRALQVADIEELERFASTVETADQFLSAIPQLETLLEPWRTGTPNAWTQSRNIGQIRKLLKALPSTTSGRQLAAHLKTFIDAPDQAAAWRTLSDALIELQRRVRQERQEALDTARERMDARAEELQRTVIAPQEAHKATAIAALQQEIGFIEAAVTEMQQKIPEIQTAFQVEFSMTDLTTLGLAGLVGWFLPAAAAPLAPAIGDLSTTGGVTLGKKGIESVAVEKAMEFFSQAYKFIESPHISHAASTRTMKAFIDA